MGLGCCLPEVFLRLTIMRHLMALDDPRPIRQLVQPQQLPGRAVGALTPEWLQQPPFHHSAPAP